MIILHIKSYGFYFHVGEIFAKEIHENYRHEKISTSILCKTILSSFLYDKNAIQHYLNRSRDNS